MLYCCIVKIQPIADLIGRPFVKRFAPCYQIVVCLSSPVLSVLLSVTFVHCGQTVGRIKMKFGMEVGLGPGHIVLDGDPAPPPPKGNSPPIFGPYPLRPNGCMDQDVTWYGGGPRPRRHCVRWGSTQLPLPKKGAEPLQNFRPMSIVAKRLNASRWHLAWRWALVQATLC